MWRASIVPSAEIGLGCVVSIARMAVSAERRLSQEAAGVHGPDRDAGADSGVYGGVKLRLIIDAVQPESAGEVDKSLLFAERAEHFRGGLEQ